MWSALEQGPLAHISKDRTTKECDPTWAKVIGSVGIFEAAHCFQLEKATKTWSVSNITYMHGTESCVCVCVCLSVEHVLLFVSIEFASLELFTGSDDTNRVCTWTTSISITFQWFSGFFIIIIISIVVTIIVLGGRMKGESNQTIRYDRFSKTQSIVWLVAIRETNSPSLFCILSLSQPEVISVKD